HGCRYRGAGTESGGEAGSGRSVSKADMGGWLGASLREDAGFVLGDVPMDRVQARARRARQFRSGWRSALSGQRRRVAERSIDARPRRVFLLDVRQREAGLPAGRIEEPQATECAGLVVEAAVAARR